MTELAVGKPIDRVDGIKKVTGTATYAAEVPVTNVLHAVIAGSAIAKGRLVSLDVAAAKAAPGVVAVITHANAPSVGKQEAGQQARILQLLQDDAIVYADQPIAVVVADTLERAQFAANLAAAGARYAVTTGIVADLEAARATAYKPPHAGPKGETDSTRGDLAAGFAAGPVAVDVVYKTPVETHNPMEPHATIAVWHGDDHLTLYDATQGIFGVRERMAGLFGLKKEDVRVIDPYVGGGFGCKGTPWSHVALCAMAARVVRRPVKLAITRQQMASLVGHRPKTVQQLKLAATRDGRLTAIQHDVASETSRFDEFVEPSALQTRMLYACPNVATSHRLVRVDAPTPTFMRAPGESTGTYALESAMDELAVALRIDPIDLRRRNHAATDEGEGKPFSSKSLLQCYEQGAVAFGWTAARARAKQQAGMLVGVGMASATYPCRQMPASARVRVHGDGSVLVQAGTQDLGTGSYTILTQLAADELRVPVERVTFELGDTALPETPVSGGSFTTSSTGSAVRMAGRAMIDKLKELATADARSPVHGLAATDVDVVDGALVARADATRRDPFGAIVGRSGKPEIEVTHANKPREDREQRSCHAFGAVFVEVNVDPLLATIRVARATGVYAAGAILNPKTARSQLMGGMVGGIGMALMEETRRDPRTARAMTRDLADYRVPTCADIPALEVITVPEDDPWVNEIGAKGIGEIGITGMAAAVANAVFHATGVRVRDLPITPDKLLRGGLVA